MKEYIIDMFNNIDVRAVEIVCRNSSFELVIEDGQVVDYISKEN